MLGFRYLTVIVTEICGGAASTAIRDNGLQVPLMLEWE